MNCILAKGSLSNTGTSSSGLPDEVLAGKLLSATLSLIGLLIGFLAVTYAALSDAGPWRADLDAVHPFLWFMTALVVAGCVLAGTAVLALGGYIKARFVLVFGTCVILGMISIFVIFRAVALAL